jgi:predicted nucleic acid-binding protein
MTRTSAESMSRQAKSQRLRAMNASCFVDTNVLLYAVSTHPSEADRASAARRILAREDFGLSAQVLQEFFVNATRKIRTPLGEDQALEFIDIMSTAPVLAIDTAVVLEAIGLHKQYALSYWDAAIVAAAHGLGARILYSEDLADGVTYGDVRVVNPFA